MKPRPKRSGLFSYPKGDTMKKTLGTIALATALAFALAAIFNAPGATWWQYLLAATLLSTFVGAAIKGGNDNA